MAVASVLVFCIPFVGLSFGIVGLVETKQKGGWLKVFSVIGIALGVLVILLTVAVLMTKKHA